MFRTMFTVVAVLGSCTLAQGAAPIKGSYLETRTCQVYTGPCFANSETALTGREAIMAWHIEEGTQQDVDLSGLSVVMVLTASETLNYQGLDDAKEIRAIIYVDEQATEEQQQALVEFVKAHGGKAGQSIVRVDKRPIEMSLDTLTLSGKLAAGSDVKVTTRKARHGDCICMNEIAYYPPLAQVENFAAGVTIEGEFRGKGLGTQWSTPDARSAYMATFSYE